MPLDINCLRVDRGGNPDEVRESQRRRFASVELVDDIIAKDDRWRFLTGHIDQLKKKRNIVQKEVATKKKANEACDDLVSQTKEIGEEIVLAEKEQEELKVQIDSMLNKIGNLVDLSVPVSKDEDADNEIVRTWGTPRNPFGLLNHHDLLWRIGGYEPERGVGVAGHRAYFLRDVGVLLNQAFINYGISFLRARGYTAIQPPYFMRKDVMAGVAQLEQFDEELYKVGGDGDDKYLIATSEQPLCGYHMNEWIPEKDLPLRYAGVSTCFRKEAGAHGKDTWGIFRVHQFEKVEQFVICEGDLGKSKAMQEEMIHTAEEYFQSLGFPYRVISIVSGALNNAAIKKLDLEAWFPGYDSFRELVSCSNCTDYQSRAMEIRCGTKKMGETAKKYVHMLNSTLCATGRAICCLLENYQEADGVRIPEVLVPFMHGLTFLPFVRESKLPDKDSKETKKTDKKEEKKEDKKQDKKESKPAAAPAAVVQPVAVAEAVAAPTAPSAPAPAAAAADVPVVSEEATALAAAVAAKGDEVRAMKAAKGSKEAITALVAELTELKKQHATALAACGGVTAPVAPASEEKKKDKPAKTSTPTPAPPATAAAGGGKAVKPAPAPVPPSVATVPKVPKVVAPTTVWQGAAVDAGLLEAWLTVYSFASGYSAGTEDIKVLCALTGCAPGSISGSDAAAWSTATDLSSRPATARWARFMSRQSASTLAAWS